MGKTKADANVKRSIRKQIVDGYLRIILLSSLLGIVTIISLCALYLFYGNMNSLNAEREQLSTTIDAHYRWSSDLISSLESGTEFTGELDPNACSFGQWLTNHMADGTSGDKLAQNVSAKETKSPRCIQKSITWRRNWSTCAGPIRSRRLLCSFRR